MEESLVLCSEPSRGFSAHRANPSLQHSLPGSAQPPSWTLTLTSPQQRHTGIFGLSLNLSSLRLLQLCCLRPFLDPTSLQGARPGCSLCLEYSFPIDLIDSAPTPLSTLLGEPFLTPLYRVASPESPYLFIMLQFSSQPLLLFSQHTHYAHKCTYKHIETHVYTHTKCINCVQLYTCTILNALLLSHLNFITIQ